MSKYYNSIELVDWDYVSNLKSVVYVLTSRKDYNYNKTIKIGRVGRDGEERKIGALKDRVKEITTEMYTPGEIKAVIVIATKKPETLETRIHASMVEFKNNRRSNHRELFNLDINEALCCLDIMSIGDADKIYIIKGAADEFGLKYNKPTTSDFNLDDHDYKKLAYDKNKDNRRYIKQNEHYDTLKSGKYSSKYVKDIIFEYDKEWDLWRIVGEDEWYTFDNLTNGPWKPKEKKTLQSVLYCKGFRSKQWKNKTGWCEGLTQIS